MYLQGRSHLRGVQLGISAFDSADVAIAPLYPKQPSSTQMTQHEKSKALLVQSLNAPDILIFRPLRGQQQMTL